MKSRIQIHLKLHTSTNLLELLTEPDPKYKKFLLKESDMILDEPATGTDYFTTIIKIQAKLNFMI